MKRSETSAAHSRKIQRQRTSAGGNEIFVICFVGNVEQQYSNDMQYTINNAEWSERDGRQTKIYVAFTLRYYIDFYKILKRHNNVTHR